ncbi:hypothetical protein QUF80_21355 [Desulfococcaceae bacterium HSG8]|nr:hypothetical protein [Desulfococcaceae bacterium HSG8]
MKRLGMVSKFVVVLLLLVMMTPPPVQAVCTVNFFTVITDLVIVRPLSIACTVAGSVLFVVGIPFSVPGGNTEEVLEILVITPGRYAFSRPVGCLRQDGGS